MDRYQAIKLNALWSVWNSGRKRPKDDDDYDLDRIIRWYAKTFHISIQQAQDLPTDHVFEVYWLETYEAMDPEELEEARQRALLDPEVVKEQQKEEDAEDFETWQLGQEMLRENAEAAREDGITKLEHTVAALKEMTRERSMFGNKESSLVMSPGPESTPDIKLEFVDGVIDEDADPFSFGLLDKPGK